MEVNCRSFEYFPEQGGHQRLLEGRESERKGEREWERGRERERSAKIPRTKSY